MSDKKCPVCGKGEVELVTYAPDPQDDNDEPVTGGRSVSHRDCVRQLQTAAARAAAFVLPTGYDEDLALKMMTNIETYGFAYVADREYRRAEQAEAEVERLAEAASMDEAKYYDLISERDELRAEVERLKCCGNCNGHGHHGGAFGCFKDVDYLFFDTEPGDHCHLEPSRWQPREEGK